MRKISVFGLGPVGLVTAVCFAKKGFPVVGIDPDQGRIESIRNGRAPFVEPSLEVYVKEAVLGGMLKATEESSVNAQSDITYITTGTPSADDGSVDLTYIRSAATAIGQSLRRTKNYQLVLVKSTVTPGTTRKVVKPILQEQSGKLAGEGFGLCSNPEFLREGNAIFDSEFPDRIVLGGEKLNDLDKLEAFYRDFYGDKTPTIIKTSYENAELIKYANNSFLAMKVSFINMVANLCQKTEGADVELVAKGIGLDKRIGPLFLNAGLGWGGSCFPKDLKAISAYAKMKGVKSTLVDAAVSINSDQPGKAIELIEKLLVDLRGKKIAVLGLAFKPDTDDLRGAVSIPIINKLLEAGAKVAVYDPAAMSNARKIFQNKIEYATSSTDSISQADSCIIVTEWDEFKKMSPQIFLENMKHPIVVDGRRIFDVSEYLNAGVSFSAIGLGYTDVKSKRRTPS